MYGFKEKEKKRKEKEKKKNLRLDNPILRIPPCMDVTS